MGSQARRTLWKTARMDEDPVLDRIGNWGKWQAKKVAAFGLVGFFFGWQMLSMNLLLPEQDFWCVNEDCSCLEEPSAMGPSSGQPPLWFKDFEPSKTSNVTKSNRTECPGDVSKTSEGGESEPWCVRWDYDRSDWPETVVSQFHLVCERDYLRSMSQSLYMAGIMIGSFVSGLLSDRFGRKRITLLAAIGLLISGLATALSPSIEVFILLRCIVAFFSISVFNCGFCYCVEIVGGRAATIVGIGLDIPKVAAPGGRHLLAGSSAGRSPARSRTYNRVASMATCQREGGRSRPNSRESSVNEQPHRSLQGSTEASHKQQVRKCSRPLQKLWSTQKHTHHVLPVLHQQLRLLRTHAKLRLPHPWKLAFQHHCQRPARDRGQRDHNLCLALPRSKTLRVWQHGNWGGHVICCALRRWCPRQSCLGSNWPLCHNWIFLHGFRIRRGGLPHSDQKCWSWLCFSLGQDWRDHRSLYWPRTGEIFPRCSSLYFWSNLLDSRRPCALLAGNEGGEPAIHRGGGREAQQGGGRAQLVLQEEPPSPSWCWRTTQQSLHDHLVHQ